MTEKNVSSGKVSSVSGPVVKAKEILGAKMHELVRVGNNKLLGEIIALEQDTATIQVFLVNLQFKAFYIKYLVQIMM